MATTTFAYDQLSSMTDDEVKHIWETLNGHCCMGHDPIAEASEEFEAWMSAVYNEVGKRGLPTFSKPQPLCCSTCSGLLKIESADCGVVYAICVSCQSRRKLGDYMNCALGPAEKIWFTS